MNIPSFRDGEAEKKQDHEKDVGELGRKREVEEGRGVGRLGLRRWGWLGKLGLRVQFGGSVCTCSAP